MQPPSSRRVAHDERFQYMDGYSGQTVCRRQGADWRRCLMVLSGPMLARLMFEDVLDVVMQCNDVLAGTLVVTSDEDAAAIARQRGAKVIGDSDETGINAAVSAGRATCAATRDGIIVVPSDIPQVSPRNACDGRCAVIENARGPGDCRGGRRRWHEPVGLSAGRLPCRYASAPRSFERHRRAALQAGVAVQTICTARPSLSTLTGRKTSDIPDARLAERGRMRSLSKPRIASDWSAVRRSTALGT